ncbi:MAG: hypothetical protein U0271_32365 [Polyangiaceae bacterium]
MKRRIDVRAGFTAVELVVAVTTGLMVAAGAYMLAKTSLDVFQQEARMNAAQFSNLMGMNRLTTDIKRAGYQTSPLAETDTVNVCVPPTDDVLKEMLTAVRVFEGNGGTNGLARVTYGGTSAPSAPDYPDLDGDLTATNNRFPDRLRLSGNFTTSEIFHLGNVELATGKIAIQVDQLSVQRVFRDLAGGGPDICDIFWANGVPHIARLLDPGGKARFLRVVNCSSTPGTGNYSEVIVTTDPIPSGPSCTADPSGGYLNPVNFVDYAAMNLNGLTASDFGLPASTQAVIDEDAALAGFIGSNTRLSLVRRELDADGNPIPESGEIVADYVADLNFSARVTNASPPYVLTPAPFETLDAVPPQRIRALGVRLTTRARNPDRETGHDPAAPPSPDQPLQSFHVFGAGAVLRYRYARVRTLFTEVSIPNLAGVTPW